MLAHLAAVVLAASLHAAPAADSTRVVDPAYRTLRVGSVVRDSLTADDQTLSDGSHAHAYDLALTEGQRVTITLSAEALESVLMIELSEGDTETYRDAAQAALRFQILRGDDDEDGRTQIRVTFTAPATGHYMIGVDGMDEDSVGAYQLGVTAGASPSTRGESATPPLSPLRSPQPAVQPRAPRPTTRA